jgi:hypothetical protein
MRDTRAQITMNRTTFQAAFFSTAGALVIGLAMIGCANEPPASNVAAVPGPQERLDAIVATLRRGFDQGGGGVITTGPAGQASTVTAISVNTQVTSHKLIPPTGEGEPLRAAITVEMKSRYTYRAAPVGPADGRGRGEVADERANVMAEGLAGGENQGEVLDSELVGLASGADAGRRTLPAQPEEVAIGWPESVTRSYDLVYQGDRWELVTEIDAKAEPLIKFAFDRALATQ